MSNKFIAVLIAVTAAASAFSGIALAENDLPAAEQTVTSESVQTENKTDDAQDEKSEDNTSEETEEKSKDKKDKSEKKSKHDDDDDDVDDDEKDTDDDDDDDDDSDKTEKKSKDNKVKAEKKSKHDDDDKEEKTDIFDGLKGRVKESVSRLKTDVTKTAKELLKEVKKLFKEAAKEERKEILAEIAEMKKELGDESIDVYVGGEEIDFSNYDNVEPVIRNDVTLIPARAVAEAMGAKVSWDGDTRTVTVEKGGKKIVLVIDSLTATVNGEEYTLISAPAIEDGRTILPLRFISESMDSNVEWDDASRTIEID